MSYKNFKELKKDVDKLYKQEKYNDAVKILEKDSKNLKTVELEKFSLDIVKLKIYICLKLKKYNKCMDIISNYIDKGLVLPLHFDSFNPLNKYDQFKELKRKNEKLIAKKQGKNKYKYDVYLPENYKKENDYPVFFALHGDGYGTKIEEFSTYWKPDPFINNDIIFVYIQSSQAYSEKGYGWLREPKVAKDDIKNCYKEIKNKYSIDEKKVLTGGYSGGAITSLDVTMAEIIPVKGIIGLCPEFRPESFNKDNVKKAAKRGVKCYFMEGENVLPIKEEEEMIKSFNENGLEYKYIINKGVGHIPPNDLLLKLESGIKFIIE